MFSATTLLTILQYYSHLSHIIKKTIKISKKVSTKITFKPKFQHFCRIQRKYRSSPFTRKRDRKPEHFTFFTIKFSKKFLIFEAQLKK